MASSYDNQSIAYEIIAAGVICTVVVILAVMLRFYARRLTTGGFGKDDYMMLFAMVVYIAYETFIGVATRFGLGRHLNTLLSDGTLDSYHLTVLSITAECLNNLLIPAVETSVLLFYHRIFPQKRFRISLWVVGSWVWITKIAFILFNILRCIPIPRNWDSSVPGVCINYNVVSMTPAVFNVVTNLIVLLMPVPLLWRLKMQRRLRIQVIFAFTIGALTCITSGVRIYYTPLIYSDLSWDAVPLVVACTVEACLFVVSGCVPTYVAILTHRNQKHRNQRSTNEYRQTHLVFSNKSSDYGISSFIPRGEKWTELNSINNPSETDQVKIITDISTTYESRD